MKRTCNELGVCQARMPACAECQGCKVAPSARPAVSKVSEILQRRNAVHLQLRAWFKSLGGH